MHPKLILASQSPRRARLLKEAGISFTCIPSRIEESTAFKRPELVVKDLACRKALGVALEHPGRPVLGADTIVFCKGRILNKPADPSDAMRLLRLQNGSWQTVYSGVALVWLDKGLLLAGFGSSRCKARRLPDGELRALSRKHPDKAGAYAVQDAEDEFIERIVGRFDTVVGLPVDLVKKFLGRAEAK